MIVKSALNLFNRIARLYAPLFASCVMLMMVANPVKADALLGVIGYHIVPMHLENSEETQEEQEQEEEESSVDDGETTVAQHANQIDNNKFKSVSQSIYIDRGEQSIPM